MGIPAARYATVEPDVRFCTTDDGVRIAYCVAGEGPDIVCCPDAVGSFALDRLIEDQMGFWRALWSGRRVVRFDMRGTGLSDPARTSGEPFFEQSTDDLVAVLDAVGSQQAAVIGCDGGGPVAAIVDLG